MQSGSLCKKMDNMVKRRAAKSVRERYKTLLITLNNSKNMHRYKKKKTTQHAVQLLHWHTGFQCVPSVPPFIPLQSKGRKFSELPACKLALGCLFSVGLKVGPFWSSAFSRSASATGQEEMSVSDNFRIWRRIKERCETFFFFYKHIVTNKWCTWFLMSSALCCSRVQCDFAPIPGRPGGRRTEFCQPASRS